MKRTIVAVGPESTEAVKYRKAYDSGLRSARRGFARVSPFAETPNIDWWFFAGFDGLSIDDAWEKFRILKLATVIRWDDPNLKLKLYAHDIDITKIGDRLATADRTKILYLYKYNALGNAAELAVIIEPNEGGAK